MVRYEELIKHEDINTFLKIKLDIDKVVEYQTELDKVINQQSPIHSIGEYRKILNLIKNITYIIDILNKYNVENLK